jgi:hypothetical protein
MWEGMTLVPGRTCGDCTVCCIWPAIDKPEIQKDSGAACKHCTTQGCAIYETRFPVCHDYFCAWRAMDMLDDSWRPDRSGVFTYIETEGIGEDFDFSIGIGLMLIGSPLKIVRQKWFQDFVTSGVMNSVPLFLAIPGPTGHNAATTSLNTKEMVDAIARGAEKDALEAAVKVLRGWDFQPQLFHNRGNDVST